MTIIDRYIFFRFLVNFTILFALMFLFAVAIDLINSLDRFVEAADAVAGDDASGLRRFGLVIKLALDFQSPRFFQFYAYLHALVAIGAMAFTLAQMHRHKELVAMLAAGLSMHRIAMPFIVAVFGLSLLQIVNQEIFLPRVAPLLLRDHAHIGKRSVDSFPVVLTPDSTHALLQSPRFDPRTRTLEKPTFLERDDRGRTQRRITADSAQWREAGPDTAEGWQLEGGRVITLVESETDAALVASGEQPIDFKPTDLSPQVLLVHRYGQFAAMLSLRQIAQMLATPGVPARASLLRYRYARFSSVLVTVLAMWLTLPTFLLREPGNLLVRAIVCAGIAIPVLMGATVFMVVDLPGIAPAVGVFLPVVVLIPIVLAEWTYVRT
ncbi:MAG: LptF/LptG family permease [Phycisphaerales bacterium]|nr:LptF/LptG family permease [Phycisphaerae bacterium]NNF43001.1 LptF/LptG family permease [Phycisphaerales bacterium]NNM25553.1 LptF/LptG family permease [Phycisphaerales bacterium]